MMRVTKPSRNAPYAVRSDEGLHMPPAAAPHFIDRRCGTVMATIVRSDNANESPFATGSALYAFDFAPATAHAFRMQLRGQWVVYDIRRYMLPDELHFVPYSRHVRPPPPETAMPVEIFVGSLPIGYDPAEIASTLSDATGATISPFNAPFPPAMQPSRTAATFLVASDRAQYVMRMLHHSAVFGPTELCICNAGARSDTAWRFRRSLRERDDLLRELLTAAGRNPRRRPMRPLVVCFPEDRRRFD